MRGCWKMLSGCAVLRISAATGVVMAAAAVVHADSVTIGTSKDNTLYEETSGTLSNGEGAHMFAGRTFSGNIRRAVLAFDVASVIPDGARIDSVSLQLNMSKTIVGDIQVDLHRLTADWGEAGSTAFGEEGFGGPAAPGDATWLHTFSATDFWTTAGGDFDPTPSAGAVVGMATGPYVWSSTAALVADVQGWLDNPASNAGWILIADESTSPTAKRFDTKEVADPQLRPQLTIDFTPCPADVTDDGTTNMPDGQVDVFDLLALLANWNSAGTGADIAPPSNVVDVFDLLALLDAWNACGSK